MTEFPAENRPPVSMPLRWLREALRSLALLRVRWDGLHAGPTMVLLMVVLILAMGVGFQYAVMPKPVAFDMQALAAGWLSTLLLVWVCWWVARSGRGPEAGTLFAVLLAQQLVVYLPSWLLYLNLNEVRAWFGTAGAEWAEWGLSLAVSVWVALAALVLLWRRAATAAARAMAVLVVAAVVAIDVYLPPPWFWHPDAGEEASAGAEPPRLRLDQALMEQQSAALIASLNAMQPQRPGVADVYAITFAPYAGEEVFRRESDLVIGLMRERFDADGRTIQLLNHPRTGADIAWASGLNLQRAIYRAASLMNRDEDILFIHLTSHGAKGGALAASFWPMEVAPVTPEQLRSWLDGAGVRHRVVSVSACYSGSWVPVLAEPGTLVMTAADAENTSYGCGRLSELTFFGRAMYDEQLRKTRSFEQAHAASRQVIEVREREAGKSDGYSNPQIAMGEAVRPVLAALAARLDRTAP